MTRRTTFTPLKLATAIAVLFHAIGLIGILFFDRQLFSSLTPFNLVLSAAALIYTQREKNKSFFLFIIACYVTGFAVEYIGVNYHVLFGEYVYQDILGLKWMHVPLVIGVNWFIIIYCCGVSVQIFLNFMWNKLKDADEPLRRNVGFVAVILDAALLATFFDWIMEPVAVQLGWWKWLGDGSVPLLNYISWFGISALLLLLFRLLSFDKQNQFAVNLLLIQFMFFLILRTVL